MIPPKNASKWILAFCLMGFVTGCSRTFTSRTVLLTARITINLNGPVDLSRYNYLLIFSRNSTVSLPPNTAPFVYFPTPGRSFNTEYFGINYGGLSTFYQDYYTTWSDYMVIGRNIRAVYKSGGSNFVAPTAIENGDLVVVTQNFFFPPTAGFNPVVEINGSSMTISFQIQQLDPNITEIFMQVATVELDARSELVGFEAGEFRDHLSAPIRISIEQNLQPKVFPDSHSNDPTIDPGSDIISCSTQVL